MKLRPCFPLLYGLLMLLGASTAQATAPVLYATTGYQSPTRAEPDDLLQLTGYGFAADDTVVYRSLADTTQPLAVNPVVPTGTTADAGVAALASTADTPYSLTVRLPAIRSGQSYSLWVRNRQGEWSNGVRINDARPSWFTPDKLYATAAVANLPRYLKVVGRNLQPAAGGGTWIRLRGPMTYLLFAQNDGNAATAFEHYAANALLPQGLQPGTYTVELTRDLTSWVAVPGQSLTVESDPVSPAQFPITRYGNCVADDDSDDGQCIVYAIAAASAAGGGDVVLGPGTWLIINGAERAGVETSNGIVVPPGVNLVGSSATTASVIARHPCWRRPAWFSLLGRNTVRNLTFRDDGSPGRALCNGTVPVQTSAVQLGKAWYTAGPGVPATVQDVTLTRNVFDRPYRAISGGNMPIANLRITFNEIGAYGIGVFLTGNASNVQTPFTITDAIISNNLFAPGSFIDIANGQGAMASELGSALRLDFGSNLADGATTTYLNAPTDARGWRAGFFWDLAGRQEQVLIARNTATCTGDKAGDGEAFAFDSNHNSFAFNSARTVASADQNSVTVPGPLASVQEGVDISAVIARYYLGNWVQIAEGPGLGQARRISIYRIDPATGLVRFEVTPAWDVQPQAGRSRLTVARQYWQVFMLDNLVDHRQPLCQKSNATAPEGGAISLWAQSADSAIEANRQYDTDGIVLNQSYSAAGDPACPGCSAASLFQSALEIRGNLIDGEYNWNSPCSLGGLKGLGGASPTPTSLPPVVSQGTSISHNTFRQVDGLRSGALELALGWSGGPAPQNWRLVNNTLVHHNRISDITGAPPAGSCNGVAHLAQQRSGLNLNDPVVWRSVLYGNTCTNVINRLQDKGTATVRVCPAGATPDSCECTGATTDLALSAVIDRAPGGGASDLRYTVVIRNAGSATASSVLLAADVLPGVRVTSLNPGTGSCANNVNTCALGSLAPGASVTVTVLATPTATNPAAVSFNVTTATGDGNPANNGTALLAQQAPASSKVRTLRPGFELLLGLGLLGILLARRRLSR